VGERAKIILNEWSAKAMLDRENLDLDKFYMADLKLMIEVAKKELKDLNNKIAKLEQENSVLKTQVVNQDKYSYGIR